MEGSKQRQAKEGHDGVFSSLTGPVADGGPSSFEPVAEFHREAAVAGERSRCALESRGAGFVTATLFKLGTHDQWRKGGDTGGCYAPTMNKRSWSSWFLESAKLSACRASRIGGGQAPWNCSRWRFGSGGFGPVSGLDGRSWTNSPEQPGPHDGFGGNFIRCEDKGGPGTCKASGRTCISLWGLLYGSAQSYGQEDVADRFRRGSAAPWGERHSLHGEVWRIRPPPGLGLDSFPGDDGHGLHVHASRKPGSGKRCLGASGSLHRPGSFGWRPLRLG